MEEKYVNKPKGYFDTPRQSFVDPLPHNPEARLLEIGTGSGATAHYAFERQKCGWCCGVELCEAPAAEARKKLNRVLVGNIENMELDFPNDHFDILLLSEVLEHLVDPWSVLKKLRVHMRKGAKVVAGSPNLSHWTIIRELLKGNWHYDPRGIWDRTHLRWFTPRTYAEMFEQAGYVVDQVGPSYPLRTKARIFNSLTGRRLEYLLHTQIVLWAHCE